MFNNLENLEVKNITTEEKVKDRNFLIGVGEFEVMKFNPTKEELKEITGFEPNEEPSYVKTSRENNKAVVVTVLLKEMSNKTYHKAHFYIEDKSRVSKKGLQQYVNNRGDSMYSLTHEWFTNHPHREAYVGGADFLNFLKIWLSKFMKDNPNITINLEDTKKLFDGNVDSLNGLIDTANSNNTKIGFLIVAKNAGQYGIVNEIYTKACLPGFYVKQLDTVDRNCTATFIDSQVYYVKQFLKQVTGEFGPQDYFGDKFILRKISTKDLPSPENDLASINKTGITVNENKSIVADDLPF